MNNRRHDKKAKLKPLMSIAGGPTFSIHEIEKISMDLELRDKTALVLGAGGGLGGAIARTLGHEGARVAVADINYEAAKNTTADISANGENAISLTWDIADLAVIDDQIATIEKNLGPIDILINNTGGRPGSCTLDKAFSVDGAFCHRDHRSRVAGNA